MSVLLDVFPGEPLFYLGGVRLRDGAQLDFGVWGRVPLGQASYLEAAFRVAARTEGVGMLAWYSLEDSSADGTYDDRRGARTAGWSIARPAQAGLLRLRRGNELTLADPAA